MPYLSVGINIKCWPTNQTQTRTHTSRTCKLLPATPAVSIYFFYVQFVSLTKGILDTVWLWYLWFKRRPVSLRSTLNSDPFFYCWVHWMALPWKRLSPLSSCLSTSVTATADRTRSTSKIKGHILRPDTQPEIHCIPQTSAKLVNAFKNSYEKKLGVFVRIRFSNYRWETTTLLVRSVSHPLLSACLSSSVSLSPFLYLSTFHTLSLSLSPCLSYKINNF